MKIFFDHKIFVHQNYGGPSRYFSNLVNHINKKKNINAKIFAPIHINNHLSFLNKEDVNFSHKIIFADKINKYYSVKRKLLKINSFINNYFLKNFKPNILHTTYYDKDNFPKDVKMVVTVYDLIHEIFYNEYGLKKSFLPKKEILERADHIICISESTKKDLIKFYNVSAKNITVTHLATHFTNKHIITSKLKFKNLIQKKYFLYVGSRQKYKNFYSLLEAIKLNKSMLDDYQLVIFGGGELTKSEKDKILSLNLNPKNIINLYGEENLLKELYKNAEFFIYPSKYEGFGIPILESFSQECPVLCSNNSSLPEVAGDAVIYFDPNNIESIAESINEIIKSNKIKNLCKKKGLERLKLFSWEKCANETIEIYKKLII